MSVNWSENDERCRPFPAHPYERCADFRMERGYYGSRPAREITPENLEALRLVQESRERDQYRKRQQRREQISMGIGGVIAWVLCVVAVLCYIGWRDGWGFLAPFQGWRF